MKTINQQGKNSTFTTLLRPPQPSRSFFFKIFFPVFFHSLSQSVKKNRISSSFDPIFIESMTLLMDEQWMQSPFFLLIDCCGFKSQKKASSCVLLPFMQIITIRQSWMWIHGINNNEDMIHTLDMNNEIWLQEPKKRASSWLLQFANDECGINNNEDMIHTLDMNDNE